ncbi:adenosine deaminase [Armatimonadetes bacterium Uphvl-Ar1]|nr:adenosine deaminase [Armatimonadetes bacterium Uphvl-Ar1]
MVPIDVCRAMPKVELHVHLEGSIRPETVLRLAERHGVSLPADSVEGLREWYSFRDFRHFVEIYVAVSGCVRTPEDIEFVAREFLVGQAEQNIIWSEVTYTAATIEKLAGVPWDEQIDALNRAMAWGKEELGVEMGLILDIVREDDIESGMRTAERAVGSRDRGVVALGLSGVEGKDLARHLKPAFDLARESGLPIVPHAGETQGAHSIWEALELTSCQRIGHGIRCLEDGELVKELRKRGMVLEVCPSSNVCLTGIPAIEAHPIGEIFEMGVAVTINSDDPPMFGTTLSDEFARCSAAFGWDAEVLRGMVRTAAAASFCPDQVGLMGQI